VETFYDISLVASGQFENKRFYSITGDCSRPGTYDLSADFTIERILKRTGNWPDHHFFAQVGGDAGGEVLNDRQLKKKAIGAGSITVYRADSYKPKNIIGDWIDFFLNQSCGKCTPCREGVYRIKEIFDSTKPDWRLFYELVNNLDATSFCGLGRAASIPITSYLRNVLAKGYVKQTDLSDKEIKEIKQCFS
jgi:NADH:ubiquinone oxidoreductase subunit F (NADH-binding)